MRLAAAIVFGVVAGLLTVVLVLALDTRDLLLDTDAWTDATAVVVEDDDARAALSALLVGRGMDRLSCESTVAAIVIRTPAGTRIARRLEREVDELLDTPRARSLWRATNRSAHERFLQATRADRPVGEDRLLELGTMADRAALLVDLVDGDGDDDSDEDGRGSCSSVEFRGGVQVLDPDALRAAGDLARTFHDARWIPTALAGGIALAALVVLLVSIGSLRRLGAGLVAAGVATLGAATFLRDYIDGGSPRLVDGIRDVQVQELAAAVTDAALQLMADHLLQLVAAGGALALVGGFLVLVGGRSAD